jgi:hypothetical protein
MRAMCCFVGQAGYISLGTEVNEGGVSDPKGQWNYSFQTGEMRGADSRVFRKAADGRRYRNMR